MHLVSIFFQVKYQTAGEATTCILRNSSFGSLILQKLNVGTEVR